MIETVRTAVCELSRHHRSAFGWAASSFLNDRNGENCCRGTTALPLAGLRQVFKNDRKDARSRSVPERMPDLTVSQFGNVWECLGVFEEC